jgi:hypothetical protein
MRITALILGEGEKTDGDYRSHPGRGGKDGWGLPLSSQERGKDQTRVTTPILGEGRKINHGRYGKNYPTRRSSTDCI